MLAYLVVEIGDLLPSPICLSAVTELSVPHEVGLMMGGRFLGTSDSEILAAQLGKLSGIEVPDGEVLHIADAPAQYDAMFAFSAQIGFVSGVIVLVLTPWIWRWMDGVR